MQSPADILKDLWTSTGGDKAALERVRLTGEEPQIPSSFRVAVAGQTTIAAAGLAAAEIWRLRSGEPQDVSVDMRHAVAECRSERYLRLDDKPPPPAWDAIAGVYKTGDNRFVRCHTNFPHHRDAVCNVLGCEPERDKVQAALMQWRGEDFETAAYAAGGVVALMRSYDEWSALPQARALAELPLVSIEKIGEAPPKPWPQGLSNGDRPLSGLRVLDLSRVIAGPVAGRTLAAHGADVLLVSGPELPAIPWLTIDTGRGKLTTLVELKSEAGRAQLRELLKGADIFSQGYRPRALAALGFAPEDAANINPGIVYVTLSAYGHAGPWAERRGFDRADHDGLQPRRGAGRRHRRSEGIAGADARSCHRLSDGVRRDDGQGAPGPRRRELARARIAGADRTLAVESRPARWRPGHPGSYGGGRTCCIHRGHAIWLRHVEGGAPFLAAVDNAGAMEPPGDAARQSSAAMAGAKLT